MKEINSSVFSIICDEITDISCKKQLSICVRYSKIVTDKELRSTIEINERFLGFVDVENTTSKNLYGAIKEYFQRIGVDISRLRGQAFDGAANMSGKFNAVAAKFREEPGALYIHCHAHLLDLVILRLHS